MPWYIVPQNESGSPLKVDRLFIRGLALHQPYLSTAFNHDSRLSDRYLKRQTGRLMNA